MKVRNRRNFAGSLLSDFVLFEDRKANDHLICCGANMQRCALSSSVSEKIRVLYTPHFFDQECNLHVHIFLKISSVSELPTTI